MEKKFTRLLSIELCGFKNVNYGKIDMPNFASKQFDALSSEILGIYGQNGSGKTAVIEALSFLKTLLLGDPLPNNTVNYINVNSNATVLTFKFLISTIGLKGIVDYKIGFSKTQDNKVVIDTERIDFAKFGEEKIQSKITLIGYDRTLDKVSYFPKYRYEEFSFGAKDVDIQIGVAENVSLKECKSLVFCEEMRPIWKKAEEKDPAWFAITNTLRNFAVESLFVVKNDHNGAITLDFAIPVAFKYVDKEHLIAGDMLVSLVEPTVFEEKLFAIFKQIIDEANPVVSSLIPGLVIDIKEYGPQLTKDGKNGVRFELISNRNGKRIPLLYESEGVKKILSIINLLIGVYNNSSFCVAIDELDAGVYEYLLGELLSVINETGKGQLVFTSHNLRPLELINKTSMRFTTTNPDNRYIKLTSVGNSNNLRDLYIRSINLGGQKEQIYEPTKEHEIRRAFRKAGKPIDE